MGFQDPGEVIVGIDIRPSDNILYAVTRDAGGTGRVYILDPDTATLTSPFTLTVDPDGNLDIDFDPTSGNLRIISDNGLNLRVIIETMTTVVETPISPPPNLFGIAYDNNVPASVTTELFAIGVDENGDAQLYTLPNPNMGTVSEEATINGLEGGAMVDAGYDIITPSNNQGYAVIVTFNDPNFTTNLYHVFFDGDVDNIGPVVPVGSENLLTGFALILETPIPCLHPRTLVSVHNGQKFIEDIRAGDRVIDHKGREIEVLHNLRFGKISKIYKIEKGTFDDRVPLNDLFISKEHPILYKGKEIKAPRLREKFGKDKVNTIALESSVPLWSLCTKERTFVMMEGVAIGTWAYEDIISKKKYRFQMF